MNKKTVNTVCCGIISIAIIGIVAFYIYDIIKFGTPITQNLFRTLAVVFLLLGCLVRLFHGERRKSLEVYEKAYKKELGFAFQNKPVSRKKLLCACRLYDESNYRKAIKYLSQLLNEAELDRDLIPVLFFLALCYTDAGVPGEAVKVYYDLLKYDPKNAQVHSNLGALYIGEGDFEMALQHYNKSIECDPENYFAYLNRANYYFRCREYENAINDAKKVLEIKNNAYEAASLLTIIYSLQKDEENKKKYYHIAITSGEKPEKLNDAITYYLNEVE